MSGEVVHLVKVAGIAGAETHLLSLLPGLRRRGWDVRLLMLHEGEAGAGEFARVLASRGVRWRRSGFAQTSIRMRLRASRAVSRAAAQCCYTRISSTRTSTVSRRPGWPGCLSVSARSTASTSSGRTPASRSPTASSAVSADTHVAVSRGLAQYLAATEGFEEDKFEIAHYGIRAEPAAPRYDGPPCLLAIGRLIPIKGHFVLLRAVALALGQVPDLELRLAGAGPLEATLRTFAAELGIADRVRLLGHVEPVRPAIEESSFVVVPSLGEGFGLVALEAMERSRAVVASAVGGLLDIVVDDVTGALVPPGEAEPLAAAIVELARDPERAARMGALGRLRVEDLFTEERSLDRAEQLYREALARRRTATQHRRT